MRHGYDHAAVSFAPLIHRLGPFEVLEAPICVVAVILAEVFSGVGESAFGRLESFLSALAGRPMLAIGGIVALAVLGRGVMTPLIGVPSPMIADETSLILQAQTWLSGHLANPGRLTPDFESVFVLLRPAYASIFPALRSAPMVLAKLIGLNFWAGVWLSMIGLCGACYWMLRAWAPAPYALVGALLVLVRYGVFSFWVNSYWGGAFTALGGVLLMGGYGRLTRQPTVSAGAAVGLGAMILSTTRPFEGLLFAFPFAVVLLVRFARAGPGRRGPWLAAGLAAALLTSAGAVLTVAHDQAVTGDWRLAPYTLYRRTTAPTPPFLFEAPAAVAGERYDQTRAALQHEAADHQRGASLAGWLGAEASRLCNDWTFYVGVALTAPFLLGLPTLRRDPALVWGAAILMAGLSVETWDFAHYAAPAFGIFLLAIVAGLQRLRRWRPDGRRVGVALSRFLPAGLAAGLALPVTVAFAGGGSFQNDGYSAPCCSLAAHSIHDSVESLIHDVGGGPAVVIAETGPSAPKSQLIVYNDADIGRARTLWINRDATLNPATLSLHPGRTVWRLDWLAGGAACLRAEGRPPPRPSAGWRIDPQCAGGWYRASWP